MALTDKLTAIADAIRAKAGTTDGMRLDQMPDLIASIEAGSGDVFVVTGAITPAERIELKANGVGFQIEHGLGVIPDFFIVKRFDKTSGIVSHELDGYIFAGSTITGGSSVAEAYKYSDSISKWRLVDESATEHVIVSDSTINITQVNTNGANAVVEPVEYRWLAVGGVSS